MLSYDFESTGTDPNQDQVISVGAALYSTGLNLTLESSQYLVKTNVPITPEITKLTGIHPAAVEKFGYEPDAALDALLNMMSQADAFVGQNIIRFDSRFLSAWATRLGRTVPDKLMIDTLTDLPGIEGKHLGYQAADHGFLNLFPHSALSDCETVLKIISMHDIDKVVERAKSPLVLLQAHQAREENDKAKKLKFRWNPDFKIWWKAVKQMDVDEFMRSATFKIGYVSPEISFEKLQYGN